MLVDGCAIDPVVRLELVKDTRSNVSEEEVQSYVEELDADVMVASNCQAYQWGAMYTIYTNDTHWQLWLNDATWALDRYEVVDLIPQVNTHRRQAVVIYLRRLTTCGEKLRLICVTTLKGIGAREYTRGEYFMTINDREAIAHAIFELLLDDTVPTLMLGNVGFGLGSLYLYLQAYQKLRCCDLDSRLQICTTGDQNLLSIFKPTACAILPSTKSTVTKLEADAPDRILVLRLTTGAVASSDASVDRAAAITSCSNGSVAASATDVPQPIARRLVAPPLVLTPRLQRFLSMLETPSHETLATVIMFPVVHKHKTLDGAEETGPVDYKAGLRLMEDALKLIHRARREAGHDEENTKLSDAEFLRALSFLQTVFESDCMANEDLKARIRHMEAAPLSLSRADKVLIRRQRRGAFKSWKWALMGNTHFLHALLRWGLFELKDQHILAAALLQEEEDSVDAHRAVSGSQQHAVGGSAAPSMNDLRQQSVVARQKLKKAKTLIRSWQKGWKLNAAERQLCMHFESGALAKAVKLTTEAYGHDHAAGTSAASVEHAAVIRAFCTNKLNGFWTADV